MVQTTDQTKSTTTTTTSEGIPGPEVIRNEPVIKTINEAPIVENIIEKTYLDFPTHFTL